MVAQEKRQELRAIAYEKIEKALSQPLDADLTAQYLQAFALLESSDNSCSCDKKESVKV